MEITKLVPVTMRVHGKDSRFCDERADQFRDATKKVADHSEDVRDMVNATESKGDFETLALSIGKLVDEKNRAYGNSFAKCSRFLEVLYPDGVPVEKYGDMLCLVRIFDKAMRIATHKHALGESPYSDIAGYALLGLMKDEENNS